MLQVKKVKKVGEWVCKGKNMHACGPATKKRIECQYESATKPTYTWRLIAKKITKTKIDSNNSLPV